MDSKKLKKVIEQAIDLCNSNKLRQVKHYLIKGIEELKKVEKKEEKKKKAIFHPQSKFNLQISALANKSTIETIERMIEEEKQALDG
jgi:hypothetical protein